MNGILNIYKEKGFTSFDVVAKLRRVLGMKKIGHTGTLDPDAEGVLPVCIGNATKLCDFLIEKEKTYETELLLGIETDTQDITGKILAKQEVLVDEMEIRTAILSFLGSYDQIPPMYSAIQIGGKRLYELAREGKEIERPSRTVFIKQLEILEINGKTNVIKLRVSCSKGTYIRTLCYDIGRKLGCGGCMNSLLRIQSGVFSLAQSKRISEIEYAVLQGTLDELLIPTDKILENCQKLRTQCEFDKFLMNGNVLDKTCFQSIGITPEPSEKFRIYDSFDKFIAIYQYDKEKELYKPDKMFLEDKR